MKTDKKTNLVIEILLVIIAIYFISPFIYMFFSSLKTETEAIAYPPKLFPEVWRFSNYIEALWWLTALPDSNSRGKTSCSWYCFPP